MGTVGYEGDKEKVYSTAGRGETFEEVLARRLSRRGFLVGSAAAAALAVGRAGVGAQGTPVASPVASPGASPVASPAASPAAMGPGGSDYEAIALDRGDNVVVAAGHRAAPLLR